MTKMMLILLALTETVLSLEMSAEINENTQREQERQREYVVQCQTVVDCMAELKEIAETSCMPDLLSSTRESEKTDFFDDQNKALDVQKQWLRLALYQILDFDSPITKQLTQSYVELWDIIRPQVIKNEEDAQFLMTLSTAVHKRMVEHLDAFSHEFVNL